MNKKKKDIDGRERRMFPSSFYWTMIEMGFYTIGFHFVLDNYFHYEKRVMERYSVNLMRSVMCLYFSLQGMKMIGDVWEDKCLVNDGMVNKIQNQIHYPFLSYFVFDTVIMFYQKYLKIEKKIRYDLLYHHGLAITSLMFIEYYKLYGLSTLITLSEGMSIVSGVKLILQDQTRNKWSKILVWYRMIYLVVIRMILLWPMIIFYYEKVTRECEEYKENRNMYLMIFLIMIIYHADIQWIHNGRKEIKRI